MEYLLADARTRSPNRELGHEVSLCCHNETMQYIVNTCLHNYTRKKTEDEPLRQKKQKCRGLGST
jgi:hypothetical protein